MNEYAEKNIEMYITGFVSDELIIDPTAAVMYQFGRVQGFIEGQLYQMATDYSANPFWPLPYDDVSFANDNAQGDKDRITTIVAATIGSQSGVVAVSFFWDNSILNIRTILLEKNQLIRNQVYDLEQQLILNIPDVDFNFTTVFLGDRNIRDIVPSNWQLTEM